MKQIFKTTIVPQSTTSGNYYDTNSQTTISVIHSLTNTWFSNSRTLNNKIKAVCWKFGRAYSKTTNYTFFL